jgi:transcriptional regulator with XRE-family HTH domain
MIQPQEGALLLVTKRLQQLRRSFESAHAATGPRKSAWVRGGTPHEALAAYPHIRQSQLSKIERGVAAPSIEVLILLADRFRKSVDWILRGEGN